MRACNSGEVSGSGISHARHRHVLGGLPPGCSAKAMGCRHFGRRWGPPGHFLYSVSSSVGLPMKPI